MDPARQVGAQARDVRRELPQVGVNPRRVLLTDDLFREDRHDVARMAELAQKAPERQGGARQRGSYAAPSARPMAPEAAAGDVEPLPQGIGALERLAADLGRREQRRQAERDRERDPPARRIRSLATATPSTYQCPIPAASSTSPTWRRPTAPLSASAKAWVTKAYAPAPLAPSSNTASNTAPPPAGTP